MAERAVGGRMEAAFGRIVAGRVWWNGIRVCHGNPTQLTVTCPGAWSQSYGAEVTTSLPTFSIRWRKVEGSSTCSITYGSGSGGGDSSGGEGSGSGDRGGGVGDSRGHIYYPYLSYLTRHCHIVLHLRKRPVAELGSDYMNARFLQSILEIMHVQ